MPRLPANRPTSVTVIAYVKVPATFQATPSSDQYCVQLSPSRVRRM